MDQIFEDPNQLKQVSINLINNFPDLKDGIDDENTDFYFKMAQLIYAKKIKIMVGELNYFKLIRFLYFTKILLFENHYRDIFVNNFVFNCPEFFEKYLAATEQNEILFCDNFNIFKNFYQSSEMNKERVNFCVRVYIRLNYPKYLEYMILNHRNDISETDNYLTIALNLRQPECFKILLDNKIYTNEEKFILRSIYEHDKYSDFIPHVKIEEHFSFGLMPDDTSDQLHISDILKFLIMKNHVSIVDSISDKLNYHTIAATAAEVGNEFIFNKYRQDKKYLYNAAGSGNLNLIKNLIEIENPNEGDLNSFMRRAFQHRKNDAIELFLNYTKDYDTLLLYSIKFRNKFMLNKAIENNPDYNSCYDAAFKEALLSRWKEIYYLFKNYDVQDMFYFACEKLDVDNMKRFHKEGAVIDQMSFGMAIDSENIRNICYVYFHGKGKIRVAKSIQEKYKNYFDHIDRKINETK